VPQEINIDIDRVTLSGEGNGHYPLGYLLLERLRPAFHTRGSAGIEIGHFQGLHFMGLKQVVPGETEHVAQSDLLCSNKYANLLALKYVGRRSAQLSKDVGAKESTAR
jgi:hypothetical protein